MGPSSICCSEATNPCVRIIPANAYQYGSVPVRTSVSLLHQRLHLVYNKVQIVNPFNTPQIAIFSPFENENVGLFIKKIAKK